MIIGTMTVAIQKVHGKNGLWLTSGGYEYNLTLIVAAAALAADGVGPISVDGLLGTDRHGARWALAALTAGAVAAAATVTTANRFRPAPEASAPLDGSAASDDGAAVDSSQSESSYSDLGANGLVWTVTPSCPGRMRRPGPGL